MGDQLYKCDDKQLTGRWNLSAVLCTAEGVKEDAMFSLAAVKVCFYCNVWTQLVRSVLLLSELY